MTQSKFIITMNGYLRMGGSLGTELLLATTDDTDYILNNNGLHGIHGLWRIKTLKY